MKLLKNITPVIDNKIVSNTLGVCYLNYFTLDIMLNARNKGVKTIHEIWNDEYGRYNLLKKCHKINWNYILENPNAIDFLSLPENKKYIRYPFLSSNYPSKIN